MTRGVRFTEDGARRIVAATRAFEAGDRDAPPIKFRDVGGDDGGELRIGKVASAWSIGTCATVTLWERTGTSCSPTEKDPAETVENVVNLSYDVPAGSWVVIGEAADGKWYLVESGIQGTCRQTIGGEDVTKWPGWSASAVQLLGHDENGCLKWFDAEECSSSSSSSGGGGGQ